MPEFPGLSARPRAVEAVRLGGGSNEFDPRVTRRGSGWVTPGDHEATQPVSHRLRQWDAYMFAGGGVPQRQGRFASLREGLAAPLDPAGFVGGR